MDFLTVIAVLWSTVQKGTLAISILFTMNTRMHSKYMLWKNNLLGKVRKSCASSEVSCWKYSHMRFKQVFHVLIHVLYTHGPCFLGRYFLVTCFPSFTCSFPHSLVYVCWVICYFESGNIRKLGDNIWFYGVRFIYKNMLTIAENNLETCFFLEIFQTECGLHHRCNSRQYLNPILT